jgi:manganese/iron transport system substrate-binding protein
MSHTVQLRQIFHGMLAVLLVSFMSGSAAVGQDETEDARKTLVCSTTQIADFARQIVGDRMRVLCVLAPGQDPHLYEIKPSDSRMVAQADLCLENGWHLEGNDWMKNLAKDAGKPIVTCVTGIQPYVVEESGSQVHDPHAWFSPRNAAIYVRNILNGVSEIDPSHTLEYQARAELYLAELAALHSWIRRQVNLVPPKQRQLVTSHDAFNYFCNEYKFVASAPAGWSTGSEVGGGVTPERRQLAVNSIREFGVKAIFVETSVNPELIQQIARDAGVSVGGELYSDSMGAPGTAGESYVGMMRENVLKIVNGLK